MSTPNNETAPETAGTRFQAQLAKAEAEATITATAKEAADAPPVITPPVADPNASVAVPDALVVPPVEKPPVSPLDEIEGMEPGTKIKPEQATHFKQLKEKAKSTISKLLEENATLKSRPAEAVDVKPYEEKLTAAEQRIAEKEAEIERIAFEQSPKYQAFLSKEQVNVDAAKSYLEGTDIDPDVIERAAKATGAKRLNVLREAGLDAEIIAAVSPHLSTIDGVRAERNAALENRKTIQAQWESEQRTAHETQTAQQKAAQDRVYTDTLNRLMQEVPTLKKVDGNEAWNKQIDADIARGKDAFGGSKSLEELAELAALGAHARSIISANKTLSEKLNTALAQLAKLTAASPNGGSLHQQGRVTAQGERWSASAAAARFNANKAEVGG